MAISLMVNNASSTVFWHSEIFWVGTLFEFFQIGSENFPKSLSVNPWLHKGRILAVGGPRCYAYEQHKIPK